MICFADNDVLLKLAACDLLEEAVFVLGSTRSEVYVLPTAKYKIGHDRQKRLQGNYGSGGVARTLEFIETVQEIASASDPEERDLLLAIDGIDAGEEVLFAATRGLDFYLVATGDKRSLRALALSSSCQPIYERMSGHIVCLEQIIARLIPHLGFEEVRSRVVPAVRSGNCDTSLKSAFGSGLQTTEDNVRRSISSRIVSLRSEVGELLIPDNDWITSGLV